MKAKFVKKSIIVLLWLICGSACNEQKAKIEPETNYSEHDQTIREFRLGLAQLNVDDQRVIFDGLPSEIKSALWKDRLAEALKMSFNREQKELLADMHGKLSATAYDSITRKDFMDYLEEWHTSAMTTFTATDSIRFRDITLYLGPKNNAIAILQQGPLPKCNCEQWVFLQCGLFQNCQPRPCKRVPCGIFNLFRCDGMCREP